MGIYLSYFMGIIHSDVMPPQGPFQCRLPEITVNLEGKMAESYC